MPSYLYQDYLDKKHGGEKAIENISSFLNNSEDDELILNQGAKQRIILVARKFRKEVTSTVLWLTNYNIRIQCIKVTPYSLGDSLFLNFEQILPVKEIEEYTISMAEKNQEDIVSQEKTQLRHSVRKQFWRQFIEASNQKNNLCQNLTPSKETWIGVEMGMTGMNMNFSATKSYASVEMYINRGSKAQNDEVYGLLEKDKEEIELDLGQALIWDHKEKNVTSSIKIQKNNVSVFEEQDWEKMIDFLIPNSEKIDQVFRKRVKTINNQLKRK